MILKTIQKDETVQKSRALATKRILLSFVLAYNLLKQITLKIRILSEVRIFWPPFAPCFPVVQIKFVLIVNSHESFDFRSELSRSPLPFVPIVSGHFLKSYSIAMIRVLFKKM